MKVQFLILILNLGEVASVENDYYYYYFFIEFG